MRKKGDKKFSSFYGTDNRGQLFLIAAVVLIVIAIGIITITNYTQAGDVQKTYEIAQGLGIESQNILDYGTYSELNESEMKRLVERFIENYVVYIKEEKNIYFIFGNTRNISVIGYQEIVNESVCVDVSQGLTKCTPYLEIGHAQQFPIEPGVNRVAIVIAGLRYDFQLKRGENFYFVVWQQIGEERIVVTSKD